MEQQIPMALQVVLYAGAIGIVVLTAVVVFFVARFKRQLDRVVTAIEAFETEVIPLARESRLAVTRVRDLSDSVRQAVGVVGDLVLPPMIAINSTSRLIQTAATTFVQSLWNGPSIIRSGRSREP